MNTNDPNPRPASAKEVWVRMNGGRKWHDASSDIDLDVPFWRFVLLAAIFGGVPYVLAALHYGGVAQVPLAGQTFCASIAALCTVPPLIWRWRRKTLPVALSAIALLALLGLQVFLAGSG